MKNKKTNLSATLLLGLGLSTAIAQQATTTTGSVDSGTGGSVSYSIGQVVYTSHAGTNGSVSQGVQQTYEIFTVGITESEFLISLNAYPNPTNDFLKLQVADYSNENLSYQLTDIGGKLIESKKITNKTESISLVNLTTATYFLKVTNNNNEVKTFKIIKN